MESWPLANSRYPALNKPLVPLPRLFGDSPGTSSEYRLPSRQPLTSLLGWHAPPPLSLGEHGGQAKPVKRRSALTSQFVNSGVT